MTRRRSRRIGGWPLAAGVAVIALLVLGLGVLPRSGTTTSPGASGRIAANAGSEAPGSALLGRGSTAAMTGSAEPSIAPTPPAPTVSPGEGATETPPTAVPTPPANPPFRIGSFDIQALSDAQLPYAGGAPLDLAHLGQATDAAGIPVVTRSTVNGGRPFHQPTGIASFGLQLLDGYRQTGDPAYLDYARRIATWIESVAVSSGGALYLPHDFAFALHGDKGDALAAGWYSGMAQGLALSFFSRLHRATGDAADLAVADRFFRSIRHLRRDAAPWVSYVDAERYLWIEEYAGLAVPDHTFNGFMFATFGLYDYHRESSDPAARQTLLGALTTLRHYAARFRSPGEISFYCLAHHTQSLKYHHIHEWQLSALSRISGDEWFLRLSRRLAEDHA